MRISWGGGQGRRRYAPQGLRCAVALLFVHGPAPRGNNALALEPLPMSFNSVQRPALNAALRHHGLAHAASGAGAGGLMPAALSGPWRFCGA